MKRTIDRSEILSIAEIEAVAGYCRAPRRRKRPEIIRALALFRLATCAGLRAGEIAKLDLGHVHTGIQAPYIELPGTIVKRGRSRRVPLTWDSETLADLERYIAWREQHARDAGTKERDLQHAPFVCALRQGAAGFERRPAAGNRLNGAQVRKSYITVIGRALGKKRAGTVTTHTGRHTFASIAATKVDLPRLQAAMGHADLSTTSVYTHVIPRDDIEPTLFTGTPPVKLPAIGSPASSTPPPTTAPRRKRRPAGPSLCPLCNKPLPREGIDYTPTAGGSMTPAHPACAAKARKATAQASQDAGGARKPARRPSPTTPRQKAASRPRRKPTQ